MPDASLWAENGGLIGLIIGALFLLVATFPFILRKMLKDEREERRETRGLQPEPGSGVSTQ